MGGGRGDGACGVCCAPCGQGNGVAGVVGVLAVPALCCHLSGHLSLLQRLWGALETLGGFLHGSSSLCSFSFTPLSPPQQARGLLDEKTVAMAALGDRGRVVLATPAPELLA